MVKKLLRFIVEVYHVIGSMEVKARNAEEAMEQVKSSNYKMSGLLKFFNHGYSGNLQVRAIKIEEKEGDN